MWSIFVFFFLTSAFVGCYIIFWSVTNQWCDNRNCDNKIIQWSVEDETMTTIENRCPPQLRPPMPGTRFYGTIDYGSTARNNNFSNTDGRENCNCLTEIYFCCSIPFYCSFTHLVGTIQGDQYRTGTDRGFANTQVMFFICFSLIVFNVHFVWINCLKPLYLKLIIFKCVSFHYHIFYFLEIAF